MCAPQPGGTNYAVFLRDAESKFHAWCLEVLRPERERRMNNLQLVSRGWTFPAFIHGLFKVERSLLEYQLRAQIGFYSKLAHERPNADMLSKPRLDKYKQRLMMSADCAISALRDNVQRRAVAAGEGKFQREPVEDALGIEHDGLEWLVFVPNASLGGDRKYIRLQAELLDVVNAELKVLEADGRAKALHSRPIPKAQGSLSKFPNRSSWLKNMLRERGWNKHDLGRNGGPDYKTTQKILDELPVREDVLIKVAAGLSAPGKVSKVEVIDIPND